MDSARIAALLAPFLAGARRPEPGALEQISAYLDLLLRWNARINLTAVRDPEYIVTRHFGESLFAATHLFPLTRTSDDAAARTAPGPAPSFANYKLQIANHKLLDLGSGAGFPGLPIKIWAPQVALTLIESRQRKATFLREVIRALALTGAEVFCGRAEDYPGPPADVVTLRAVERFDDVLPIAARLLASTPYPLSKLCHSEERNQGPKTAPPLLALLIGESQIQRARILLPAFSWSDPLPIPLSSARVLLIGHR